MAADVHNRLSFSFFSWRLWRKRRWRAWPSGNQPFHYMRVPIQLPQKATTARAEKSGKISWKEFLAMNDERDVQI